ncbi:hypothetical protein BLNAU_9087 [Blattamonas nauphoetae]|uniref:Protein kinase domain-containing protein n=1 Tax=Blattamonas nauphoetae TaxID=2049346 RepID=A0ABQ9XWS3_9EUKA|nr:hypothetical protein BLNAU_9087 [Blattamonas nauphoetae]
MLGHSTFNNEAARLAVVCGSLLTIADSIIAVSPSTSPILISSTNSHSSMMPASVVMDKCSIWNDIREMRGVVETSAFPDFGGSISVSIVGCSFDSSRILGKDGIGLSLTPTAQKRNEEMGMISSSLIGCSFVNMSSIGSSRLPHLPHLSQKMLGCVVSLTSSHLSGSTIRDMNNGGSVLCSNSSFSSLLSSPNSNPNEAPSITPAGDFDQESFHDGTVLSFNVSSGTELDSVSYSRCTFTGDPSAPSARPLTFRVFPGTISILSCSFTGIASPEEYEGGAVLIYSYSNPSSKHVRVESCNFTTCWTRSEGGGLCLSSQGIVTVTGCRCVGCYITDDYDDEGGGMDVYPLRKQDATVTNLYFEGCTSNYSAGGLSLRDANSSHLKFVDCSAELDAGGMYVYAGDYPVSVTDSEFLRCEVNNSEFFFVAGGGLSINAYELTITVAECRFIDCASTAPGGATTGFVTILMISDCLVQNCSSEMSGAVHINPKSECNCQFTLTDILFVGNTVSDNPPFYDDEEWYGNPVQFADILIEDSYNHNVTDVTINDCWTTTTPNSVGRYVSSFGPGRNSDYYVRGFLDAFSEMGPYLTHAVEMSLDVDLWRIDLRVEGKIPLKTQVYDVTVKETEGECEISGKLQFIDGVGSLHPSSNLNLNFSTTYTVTKIVGVVAASSSLMMTNDIPITAEAWAFNLAKTPDFLSFTTPSQPPTLVLSTAHLTDEAQPFAFLILIFDREVSGSYDVVVEERGKDERITVIIDGSSIEGKSQNFLVVGDDRVLTHDTTYTIKSIVPTEGSDTATTVWMNKTVTFHIPKSSFDTKKTMSPEMKALLSWLIPLVACLLLALIILIVVFVLVYRRKKKNTQPSLEMEAQDQVQIEDKMEVVDGGCTHNVIHTDGMSHSAFDSSDDLPTFDRSREGVKSQTDAEWEEVMMCNGAFEILEAPMNDTLYTVLHKEHREIGRRAIGVQIVNGLKQVVATRGWSDVLTHLSSHWVLVDSAGNVQLKLQMNASEAEQEAAQTQSQKPQSNKDMEGSQNRTVEISQEAPSDKSGIDGLRWRAPEVVGSKGGQVDGHKAAVFSLGLVLWEIETGHVPFGELDAVNAQRQSGTGTGPKMDTLKNEEFVSLIRRCVSVDPEQRPTLTEVGEFLISHPDETVGGSRNEMKE